MSDHRTSIPFILDAENEEELPSLNRDSSLPYRPTTMPIDVTDAPQPEAYNSNYNYDYERDQEPERPRFSAIYRADNAYEYAPNDIFVPVQVEEDEHYDEEEEDDDLAIVKGGRRHRVRATDFFAEGGSQEQRYEEYEQENTTDIDEKVDALISQARQKSRRRLTRTRREATLEAPEIDLDFTPTPERDLAEMSLDDAEDFPSQNRYTSEDIYHMSNTKRMLLEKRGVIDYANAPSPDPYASRVHLKLPTRRQRKEWHEDIARDEEYAVLRDQDIPPKPYPPPYLTPREYERERYYRDHSDRTFMGDYFRIGRSMIRFS